MLQLDEEKADLARQLTHERDARLLQERINDENLKFSQKLSESDPHNTSVSAHCPHVIVCSLVE